MSNSNGSADTTAPETKGCSIKLLPSTEWIAAAERAIGINPANAPMVPMLLQGVAGSVPSRDDLALLTTKYWGSRGVSLTVSFLDNPASTLRNRIVKHMNAWGSYANVKFVEVVSGGKVRIALRKDGHWSYLGTDILHPTIQKDEPTMNLDSFTMETPESEFLRVVRHETGHTLGFPHEHQTEGIVRRIDREKAIKYFKDRYNWPRDLVIQQVLTALDKSALIATAASDPESIMCYWLPAEIMIDHTAVPGGRDINAKDGRFAGSLYPRPGSQTPPDDNVAGGSVV